MKPAIWAVFVLTPFAFGAGCEGVKDLRLGNTTITAAEVIAAGAFTQTGPAGAKGKQNPAFTRLPSFCRVAATLTPTPDSDIKIEVWMPMTGWNNDLQSVGNGAWAGSIGYAAMATAIGEGYAAASTDTGHVGNVATFIPGHPEKLTDFAWRAVHEMTIAAKAIVEANYGRRAAKSYFNGCSTGGRQAMVEAQRFPGDYDGIIAGAPANFTTALQGAQLFTTQAVNKTPESMIPASKYAVLKDAALKACDAADGVKDGVIENPMKCKFDPAVLACKGEETATCLTAAQVESARLTYAGPRDSKGKVLFPGMEPGSESGWATLSSAKPMAYAEEIYQHLVFNDLKWNYMTFVPERDMKLAEQAVGPLMNSTDPNLRPFFYRGGKLLMYHGWADPGIAPRNSVNYYESVVKTLGAKATDNEIKLFMVPGMGHCGGGDGTSTFNMMTAIKDWVEGGKTPETIPASRVQSGQTVRTRPLCAYPKAARYKGTGSTDDASNFTCE